VNGQEAILVGHCPLTGRYIEPCPPSHPFVSSGDSSVIVLEMRICGKWQEILVIQLSRHFNLVKLRVTLILQAVT
jgi:hypothetical protein